VFTGHRAAKNQTAPAGPRLADVARRAEVAVGTTSAVLSGRPVVAEATVARVLAAVEELGYVRGRPAGRLAAHWIRDVIAWACHHRPVPREGPRPARPVPILASPWPGVPVRGRGALEKPMPAGCRLPQR